MNVCYSGFDGGTSFEVNECYFMNLLWFLTGDIHWLIFRQPFSRIAHFYEPFKPESCILSCGFMKRLKCCMFFLVDNCRIDKRKIQRILFHLIIRIRNS